MRILAEDDLTSRTMLAAALKKSRHAVEAVSNGLKTWEEVQKPDAPRPAWLFSTG